MTPYYQEDGITIYHGDCRDLLPVLKADLVLTDPPYGIKYKSRHNSSWRQKGSRWEKWDRYRRPTNFPSIAGDDKPFDPSPWLTFGRCAFFGGNYCADKLPPSGSWIIWDKQNGPKQADCEMIWTNFGKPARIYRHLWNGIIREGEENVSREPKWHPHQKPLALLRFVIKYSGIEIGGKILDQYCGSGSTLVAARQMGHPAVGVEIKEKYCEIAAKRLSQGVLAFE